MNERPWWRYACEMVFLGLGLSAVILAGTYAWSRSDALPISPNMMLVVLGGLSVLATLVVLLKFAGNRDGGLWELFRNLLSWM